MLQAGDPSLHLLLEAVGLIVAAGALKEGAHQITVVFLKEQGVDAEKVAFTRAVIRGDRSLRLVRFIWLIASTLCFASSLLAYKRGFPAPLLLLPGYAILAVAALDFTIDIDTFLRRKMRRKTNEEHSSSG